MKENKKILLSGKLTGTRTFSSELEQIQNPDNIEKFLLSFSNLKIDIDDSFSEDKGNNKDINEENIIHINDDQDLLEVNATILSCKYIGVFHNDDFSKLYLTTDEDKTYIITLNNISPSLISVFISSENTTKYLINSFNFIKWCASKNIEIKSLYDIPTYIKLLTNDVDPFKNVENYLAQYTNYKLFDTTNNIANSFNTKDKEHNEDNDNKIKDTENYSNNTDDIIISVNEKNNILFCNFISKFGAWLSKYIEEFDLSTVNKLINENSYYEGNNFSNNGNCKIIIKYTNIDSAITNISQELFDTYRDKAYIISPLNRIAPKFKHNSQDLIYELFTEDLSITILNELYNNNIPVKLNYETNQYIITCKYKNFSNIITLLNAIFCEAFLAIFDQTPEMHLDCEIKN